MGIKIGIIGGSGLDNLNIFTNARDTFTGTVWGEPSSPLREGEIAGIPVPATLRQILIDGCRKNDFPFHPTGTVVTIEGPRFSTKAESRMFRMWGADVINMSVSTETALANEAGIPYAAVAMSTDYDCWKEDEAPVSWEEVSLVFKQNAEKVTTLLVESVPAIAQAALK